MGARYATRSGLHADEAAILGAYGSDIAGKRILDLGVGGGRTTPYLLDLSDDYVGADYSAEMIAQCRARFPGVRFEVADARDLSCFADASFDFVLFSFNGIDAAPPEGRSAVLTAVRRVLAGGGLFVFSSHNRRFPILKPWNLQHFAINPLRDPVRFGKRAISYPVGIMNYLRRAHHERANSEYCVSVDSAHLYSLVHYRIDGQAQIEQLERAGFEPLATYGANGSRLSARDLEITQDPWIQYVSRRRRNV